MFNTSGFRTTGANVALFYPADEESYSQSPEDLFPGMSSDGTDLTIPIAALEDHGLTAALAATTTGDARTLAYALCARIEEWYTNLDEDLRPLAFIAKPSASIVSSRGDFASKERTKLEFTAYRDRPSGAVAEEPESSTGGTVI